jgi:hypothetical protein
MPQINDTIATGVKLFVQMTGLAADPYEEKFVRDEEDLRIALEQVADNLKYTAPMVGKQMYRNQPFSFTNDVKLAMEETLLVGEDARETAGLRRRNLTMYHLILEPVIDELGTISHTDAIAIADEFVQTVYHYATQVETKPHFDDALVAKAIVKSMVKEREAARKALLAEKKKAGRKKAKKEVDDLIKEVEADPVDDVAE